MTWLKYKTTDSFILLTTILLSSTLYRWRIKKNLTNRKTEYNNELSEESVSHSPNTKWKFLRLTYFMVFVFFI